MKALCVIPARYASTRLPGKPLANIGGKPMIQWVYERACKAESISDVIIATDNSKIEDTVKSFGGQVVLTPSELPSGTDRVAWVAKEKEVDIVINLQGDEPFISAKLLDKLVGVFTDSEIEMATPIRKIEHHRDLNNPNLVRVIRNKKGFAIYFSRSVIPFVRDVENQEEWLNKHMFFKHIGIYAYRKELLLRLTGLSQSPLERAEKLEQLRAIENGIRIYTIETEYESIGVDTPQDLERVNNLIKNNNYEIESL